MMFEQVFSDYIDVVVIIIIIIIIIIVAFIHLLGYECCCEQVFQLLAIPLSVSIELLYKIYSTV